MLIIVSKTQLKNGFDEVIFSCHADTALNILKDASTDESEVLSHFRFTKNTAVLHTDTSILPKKPLAWASWNYLIDEKSSDNMTEEGKLRIAHETPAKPVLTYHMNILQRLTKKHNYFTVNPSTANKTIDEKQVIKSIDYSHPVFDQAMIEAQTKWLSISNGTDAYTFLWSILVQWFS